MAPKTMVFPQKRHERSSADIYKKVCKHGDLRLEITYLRTFGSLCPTTSWQHSCPRRPPVSARNRLLSEGRCPNGAGRPYPIASTPAVLARVPDAVGAGLIASAPVAPA